MVTHLSVAKCGVGRVRASASARARVGVGVGVGIGVGVRASVGNAELFAVRQPSKVEVSSGARASSKGLSTRILKS